MAFLKSYLFLIVVRMLFIWFIALSTATFSAFWAAEIHGHFDALQRLKREFGYNPIDHQILYLGDYIDRGPNSYKVVKEVMRDVLEGAIALLGNHDRIMINALREPNRNRINDTLLWLRNGGQKTLDSYKNRKGAMKNHLEFLATLPLYVESDKYFFVHAGVNPTRKIKDQTEEDFLWIREEFLNASDLSRATSKIVIFGHSPTIAFTGKAEIFIAEDRIGVDTGAGFNKRLSAFDTQSQCCYSVEVGS
ncbi:MAG TPA: metallophosphoesterase family protein [Desulfosporosinus sp.]|nr:metallophosphoesterase family protein [Desulfosporosinus sp.]